MDSSSRIGRVIAVALAAVMAVGGLSTPAQAATPAAAVQTVDSEADAKWRVKTVRSASNIRSGPSTSHSIVGSASGGQQVTVKWVQGSRGDSWWALSGGRGYIANSQLVAAKTKPAPPEKAVTKWVKATTGANLRSGPSTGHSIVDSASYRSAVQVNWVRGSAGDSWWRTTDGRYISNAVLAGTKPSPSKPKPGSALRAEAERWADRVTGVDVQVTWSTERWRYGWSYPQWWVARERGIYLNESKIRAEQGDGQRAVDVARGVAVHESVHYLQAREYGDATLAPVAGRGGVPGYEVQADCATHVIGWLYGVSMPTFYLGSCTSAEYDQARKLLRAQGVL